MAVEPPLPEPPLLDVTAIGKAGLKIPNDWAPFPFDSLKGMYKTPFASAQWKSVLATPLHHPGHVSFTIHAVWFTML